MPYFWYSRFTFYDIRRITWNCWDPFRLACYLRQAVAQARAENLRWFPPYLRCVTDALDRIPFGFGSFDKNSHWKWRSKSLEICWKMEPKWRHKSAKSHKIVKQIHAASHESTYVHKNGKPSWITYPRKLDFDALAYTGAQFALFHNWSDCDLIGGPRPAKSTPGSTYRSKKMEVERFMKHVKNVTTKVPTSVTNMLQKEGLKKLEFLFFLEPYPRMVSKASPDRLQGLKAC